MPRDILDDQEKNIIYMAYTVMEDFYIGVLGMYQMTQRIMIINFSEVEIRLLSE